MSNSNNKKKIKKLQKDFDNKVLYCMINPLREKGFTVQKTCNILDISISKYYSCLRYIKKDKKIKQYGGNNEPNDNYDKDISFSELDEKLKQINKHWDDNKNDIMKS